MSTNLNITALTASQNNKEVTVNDGVEAIDAALTEVLTSDFTSGNVSLTNAQLRENVAHILDNVSVARVFTVPAVKHLFVVTGEAGNTNTATVTVGSSTETINAGDVKLFYTDGTANGLFAVSGAGAGDLVLDTSPQLGGTLDTNSFSIHWSKGADVASANALPLLSDGNYVDVTGTSSITSFNTVAVGTFMVLHFDGAMGLVHHATDLILPTGANIVTAAGDEAMFIEYAAGDWRCVNYSRADGTPLAGGGGDLVDDLTPQLGGALDTNSFSIHWSKGADVASATALPLLSDGNYVDVTGTTTVTSFNTVAVGTFMVLHFDGILTLTHHATDLVLPTGANITTAAGDEAMFIEYAAGDWRCVNYSRADGTTVAGVSISDEATEVVASAIDINFKGEGVAVIDSVPGDVDIYVRPRVFDSVKREHVTSNSWITSTSSADNAWQAVAWATDIGLFAAVSSSGTGTRVMTSPDGVTWTTRTSASDQVWRGITRAVEIGLFAAVSSSGGANRVMTSPDGITWTARVSATTNNWFDITWSPELGLFAAVANSGTGDRVMTSPDGITWTSRTSASDNDWDGITWSPELGLFVAVSATGIGNRVMTSPDGLTWTSRTSAGDFNWRSIAWSPELGLFAAVANSGAVADRVMTSPDGITWTKRPASGGNNWASVTWSTELGLFAAIAGSGTGDRVMTSPDGTMWISRTSATDNNWTSTAWSPELGLFAAVASSGTGDRVMTSKSGHSVTYR